MHEKLHTRWRSNGPPKSACRGRLQTTLKWHWLKTVVASVEGEIVPMWHERYGSRRRAQANHRQGVDKLLSDIKTEGPVYLRDKFTRNPAYRVSGVRRKGGVISIWARVRNCGNSGP